MARINVLDITAATLYNEPNLLGPLPTMLVQHLLEWQSSMVRSSRIEQMRMITRYVIHQIVAEQIGLSRNWTLGMSHGIRIQWSVSVYQGVFYRGYWK